MTTYQIPEGFLSGFKALSELSEKELKKLVNAFEQLSPGNGINQLKQILGNANSSSDTIEAGKAVFSLGPLLIEEVNENIPESIADSVWRELEEVSDERKNSLQKNLEVVLERTEGLKKTFKAYQLLSENACLYRKSRVMTDLRYVFEDDFQNDSDLEWGIVIHHLKFELVKNGKKEEVFISMENDDIEKLQETLNRALQKAKKIKANNSQVKFIEIT